MAADASVPISFPYMDGYEWQSLRNGFAPATAMAMEGNLLGVGDKFKHYLDSYRQHFHPFFPVIQYSSLISTPPPPLLALLMVVIGAQFSHFPESKNSTAFLYESCVGFLSTVSKSYPIIYPCRMLMRFAASFNNLTVLFIRYANRYPARGFFTVSRTRGEAGEHGHVLPVSGSLLQCMFFIQSS